jgi:hypothetical protein
MLDEAKIAAPDILISDARKQRPADPLDGMSLSLIDMKEVERILLLDRVVLRFTEHYDASVNPLTQRLAVLLGLPAPALSRNPFRPEVFVRAFLLAWEQSGLDEQATADLMLALDPRFSVDLGPLYAKLNATLMYAGIEAHPVHRIRKSDAGADPQSQSQDAPASTDKRRNGAAASHVSVRASLEVAPSVGPSLAVHARQFLQQLGQGSQRAANDPGGHRDFVGNADTGTSARSNALPADPDFVALLTQRQALAQATLAFPLLEGQGDPGDPGVLRELREQDETRKASQLDRGTVDTMVEVFDFVFADPAVASQMKSVIGRLQIPVLKAAMLDREFFLSADQPARRLIDTLAKASIAWTPEKGDKDPLYLCIENTIERVLSEFEDDITLFGDLVQEVTEFLFETEQQAQRHIAPVAEHETETEILEQALVHADQVVNERIEALAPDLPLAAFLRPFLRTQWREVLARTWMNFQIDPAQWEGALSCMDQLIWSTQPKTRSKDRHQLVAMLPSLVRDVNAGLDLIEWNGKPRAVFTRRLIATHTLAIRMTKAVQAGSAPMPLQDGADSAPVNLPEQRLTDMLAGSADEFDAIAHNLTRDLWLDFRVDERTWQRRRLSWVSPMRSRMLFTNSDGFDPFVRSEREVAALLRYGRALVIDPQPIVSRALASIMSDLRDRQAA